MTQPQGQVLLAMLGQFISLCSSPIHLYLVTLTLCYRRFAMPVDSRRFHMVLDPVDLTALPLNERARATFSWTEASEADAAGIHHQAHPRVHIW